MSTKPSTIFGANIRTVRRARGLSQGQVIDHLEWPFDRSALSSIEHGKHGVSLDFAIDVCRVLDVDPVAMWSAPLHVSFTAKRVES